MLDKSPLARDLNASVGMACPEISTPIDNNEAYGDLDSQDMTMNQLQGLSGKRILAAMSGGVDSSLAAALLREAGADVSGASMRLLPAEQNAEEFFSGSCCSIKDMEDAGRVCAGLGISWTGFHMEQEFEEHVILPFIRAYENGETPNPCIECNRFLKFELFLKRALSMGFDLIATGHYARVVKEGDSGRFSLFKGRDPLKDQSYVLYMLTQEELSHLVLPLGELTKEEVRELAKARGLPNAEKKESQDICFIPDGDYAAFMEARRGSPYPPGDFLDTAGKRLGRHKGQIAYTLGQRRGLGIALGERTFVVAKDPEKNTVTIGEERLLMAEGLLADRFNWIMPAPKPGEEFPCLVKTRYRQREVPARAVLLETGEVSVRFDTPVRAVTPGQAAVLYDGDRVLGGGTIRQALGSPSAEKIS